MRKIFLASHGSLAEGMLSALQMILGQTEHVTALGLDRFETPQHIYDQIKAQMEAVPEGTFLILCDVMGGSVFNQLLELACLPRVTLFAGMNLNLALKLALGGDEPWEQEREQAIDQAREGLFYFDSAKIQQMQEKEAELW